MWIFGYGSLIWKTDFPVKRSLFGYVEGYLRRFWQMSEDHRGTPSKPGRVVTLVETSNRQDHVWGIAYEVEDDNEIISKLDYREKDGYEKIRTTFYPCDEKHTVPFEIEVYVGNEHNPYFLGPANLNDMARQIYEAEGPSGKNSDYLFNLADAIRKLTPDSERVDQHLFELESAVKKLRYESSNRS